MKKSKKSKRQKLEKDLPLCESAVIILSDKVKKVNKTIKEFLSSGTNENLHQVRIAVRRLRYNMEAFSICFDKKKFLIFYSLVEHLQDITGIKRDLDILSENILSLSSESNLSVDAEVISKIEEKKNDINKKIVLELTEYLNGKELKEFMKQLS